MTPGILNAMAALANLEAACINAEAAGFLMIGQQGVNFPYDVRGIMRGNEIGAALDKILRDQGYIGETK